jgi:hypothetical protein
VSDECGRCPHELGAHKMYLVRVEPFPMGIMLCPDCRCSSTWAAGPGRSDAERIRQTRTLVREQLIADGEPLPTSLQ